MNTFEYRDRFTYFLRDELLGPLLDVEDIFPVRSDYPPATKYSLGKLYPKAQESAAAGSDETENLNNTNNAAGDSDPLSLAFESLPSSVGISICVEKGTQLQIQCKAGVYKKENHDSIDWWNRYTLREGTKRIEKDEYNKEINILEGSAALFLKKYTYEDKEIITVSLTNIRETKKKKHNQKFIQEDVLYRVSIDCQAVEGSIIPFPAAFRSTDDEEEDELNFLYRHKKIYASGHGCSVKWKEVEGKMVASTEFMPQSSMYRSNTMHPSLSDDSFVLSSLCKKESTKEDLKELLNPFLEQYEAWINQEIKIIYEQGKSYPQASIENIINNLQKNLERMKEGLNFITSDGNAFNAFKLANKAMLMQMVHAKELTAQPKDEPDFFSIDAFSYEDHKEFKWRPFQLGFFLLSVISTAKNDHSDRETVDLVWFPTGGGKTEAYLLIIAFEIFYRRLNNEDDEGVVVFMRYTLRLLTADQFTRAASMICCCEVIRTENLPSLGETEISLGLWVGGSVTPNTYLEALVQRNDLLNDDNPINPFILSNCPWCKTDLLPKERKPDNFYGFQATDTSFKFSCPSSSCKFHTKLPLNIVDDHLYTNPPTLLIGTIDKFARLAWTERPGVFLGLGEGLNPPSLIIQDELHLINGPLGTIAGVYEAAFDTVIKSHGGKPKYIAATATIRGSKNQCQKLYNRNVNLFPPTGNIAEHSFFSTPDPEEPDRRYLGIMTQGQSAFTSTIRVSAAALQAIQEIEIDESSSELVEARDSYSTLMVYHNTIRELGRTLSLSADDIPDRISAIQDDPTKRREIDQSNGIKELSSKIPNRERQETREAMKIKFGNEGCIDILAVTNIISVGIDEPRLGLMEVAGQPKTTAEFIQASSRVGRANIPGLVLVNYKATDTRDRSHYEQFVAFIDSAYKYVEPSSVTPYTLPARERSLHAALVIALRHSGALPSNKEGAHSLDLNNKQQLKIIDDLKSRMVNSSPQDKDEIVQHIEEYLDEWQVKIEKNGNVPLLYDEEHPRLGLMKQYTSEREGWPTLQSMRNVDTESVIDPR